MSVYHEFTIKVESAERPPADQEIMCVTQSGNGGLLVNLSNEIRNRDEWLDVKAAFISAGAQLGWY